MPHRIEKVCVLGNTDVGKTCVTLRFVEDRFDESAANTIGAAFKSRYFTSESGTTFKFQIWDTAGQERYKALAPMYYRGASVVILVFDLNQRSTLQGVKYWMQELQQNGPEDAVIALVGNKRDLAEQGREVSTVEGRRHAKAMNAFYWETSAKTGENIMELFEDVCTLLENRAPTVSTNHSFRIGARTANCASNDEEPRNAKQRRCCSS